MGKRNEQDEFYDRVYEEWRRGHNPDDLSMDRWDDFLSRGFYPDEITTDMLCPHKRREDKQ